MNVIDQTLYIILIVFNDTTVIDQNIIECQSKILMTIITL